RRASPEAPLRAEVSWTFEWRLSFGMAPADAYKTVGIAAPAVRDPVGSFAPLFGSRLRDCVQLLTGVLLLGLDWSRELIGTQQIVLVVVLTVIAIVVGSVLKKA